MDVTLVGEDDLDFVLHGTTLMTGLSTVQLLGLVKIQLQCSTTYDMDTDKINFHK